ncbi:MAG: cation-binding protein [Brevundimonas sp.]|uniref:Hemerythrin domain-containing protein n=1 Tax=Brevundimonas albigilva TaxID=1312364 RepID=A0ABY4SL06_9CAUL|nr:MULTISPECIES: hemerythrin domain-containing protein [Brevundimonas]PZU60034.1 MAG: cation-binding protein [Brevundimonas sp.]URI14954.1 hemerythrin domain-containing protein [Brevundimonas albigilva]
MDITQLILDDHAEQRRLFAIIEQIDPKDTDALTKVWSRLSAFLDVHAEAEERFFYPQLLKLGEGANDAEDGTVEGETEDAIEDHNKLRDAVKAVAAHAVGSKAWFEAVGQANVVNSKHMGEEERQGLTDFRINADVAVRHDLAVRFAAFEAEHITGVKPVNKDPEHYVDAHA